MTGVPRLARGLVALALCVVAVLVTAPPSMASPPSCDPVDLGTVPHGQSVNGSAGCVPTDPAATAIVGYSIALDATLGVAQVDPSTGAITYTAPPDTTGSDSFDVQADDDNGESTTFTVTVEVTNSPPLCDNVDLGDVIRGDSVSGAANCTDADGDTLVYDVPLMPLYGLGSINSTTGALGYDATDTEYTGDDTWVYDAYDGIDYSFPADVFVWVLNRQPVIDSLTKDVAAPVAGQTITFTGAASDPDNDSLEYFWDLDNDGEFDDGSGTSASSAYDAGVHTVWLLVSDYQANDSEQTQSLEFSVAPAGGGGAPPGGSNPGGTPPAGDTTPPNVKAATGSTQRIGRVIKRGLRASLTVDEASSLRLFVMLNKKTAKKLRLPIVIGKLAKLVQPGSYVYRVALSRKAARKLKRLRRVKVLLSLSAKDAAGNAFRQTLQLTLKR